MPFLIALLLLFQQSACPVKIIKYHLSHDELNDNVIVITYENTSKKDIDALTVSVSCYDNFNEPVNGNLDDNIYKGISQTVLKAGRKERSSWTMYLFDNATKVSTPVITKVHFTDGTSWEATL